MKPITVVVADDHPVIRAGMIELLSPAGITVVGEAADGQEALSQTLALKPDVVLMDLRMPTMDGLQSLEAIKQRRPAQQVIMFSAFDDRAQIGAAFRLGAADFLLKGSSPHAIVAAVKRVAQRVSLTHKRRQRTVPKPGRDPNPNRPNNPNSVDKCRLTDRERQILQYVAAGQSNNEIGRSLEISAETVKVHVGNILRKMDVSDRTQAAVAALREGWI